MPEVNIVSEEPMNIYTVKDELAKIKKRDGELNFRAARTEEYVQQTGTFKKAKELEEKIRALDISRLKEQHIQKIIDIQPISVKDLKGILQGYTITVSKTDLQKIIDTIKELV